MRICCAALALGLWAPTEAGERSRATDDPAQDAPGGWSPDGSQIVFWSERGGSTDLWILSPDLPTPVRRTS